MTTTALVSWAITAIGSEAVISTARAFDHTTAWTPARTHGCGAFTAGPATTMGRIDLTS